MKTHKENQGDYFPVIRCILRTGFDGQQSEYYSNVAQTSKNTI